MVVFNIVEGDDDWRSRYPEFKEDFLNAEMKVSEIKDKYNLTLSKYNYLRNKALDETGLKEKPSVMGGRHYTVKDTRYIYEYNNGYCRIQKTIDKVKKGFGTYPDIETAKIVRDKLVECNWDDNVAKELKKLYSHKKRIT